jgi:hypothetical protein
MRRTVSTSAVVAMLLLLTAPTRSQQEPQQNQSQQDQRQPSTAQGQNQAQAPAAQKESLADAARKAREQKKEAPKAAKVFTNDNIPTTGGISSVGKEAANTEAGSPTPAEETKASSTSTDERKWRDRFAELDHKLDQDQAELDIMQRELGVLSTQYYSDPTKQMQQQLSREDINKKTADIEAKKKQVEADKQAIADAQDELRKSGGDPGWANPQ